MDDVCATQCFGAGEPWFQTRSRSVAHINGPIRCIIIAWWPELYRHNPEHAYKGNEYDKNSADHMVAVLHCHPRCIVFPGVVVRFYPFAVRPQSWNKFLPQ